MFFMTASGSIDFDIGLIPGVFLGAPGPCAAI